MRRRACSAGDNGLHGRLHAGVVGCRRPYASHDMLSLGFVSACFSLLSSLTTREMLMSLSFCRLLVSCRFLLGRKFGNHALRHWIAPPQSLLTVERAVLGGHVCCVELAQQLVDGHGTVPLHPSSACRHPLSPRSCCPYWAFVKTWEAVVQVAHTHVRLVVVQLLTLCPLRQSLSGLPLNETARYTFGDIDLDAKLCSPRCWLRGIR